MEVPQFRRPIHHTKEQKRHIHLIMETTKVKKQPSFQNSKNNYNQSLHPNKAKSSMQLSNALYTQPNWYPNKKEVVKKYKHVIIK